MSRCHGSKITGSQQTVNLQMILLQCICSDFVTSASCVHDALNSPKDAK